MTAAGAKRESHEANGPDGEGIAAAWARVRDDGDLQFAEVPMPEAPPPPDWLLQFLGWLAELLAPLGRLFAGNWEPIQWALLAMAMAGALWLGWRLIGPALAARRQRSDAEAAWAPGAEAALALLEEADRLAAKGRFDEATHLLLQRAVSQIAAARPDWIEPSTTAREISALPQLPEAARSAFAIIAGRVERSLFALQRLSAEDWQAARAAYADFALQQGRLAA